MIQIIQSDDSDTSDDPDRVNHADEDSLPVSAIQKWEDRKEALTHLVGGFKATCIVEQMKKIRNQKTSRMPSSFSDKSRELYKFCTQNLPEPHKRFPKAMMSMLDTVEYANEIHLAQADSVKESLMEAHSTSYIDLEKLISAAHGDLLKSNAVHKIVVDAAREDTESTTGFHTERAHNPHVGMFLDNPTPEHLSAAMMCMFQRVDDDQQRKRNRLGEFLKDEFDDNEETPPSKRICSEDTAATERITQFATKLYKPLKRELWLRDCGTNFVGTCQCCFCELTVFDAWEAAHIIAKKNKGPAHVDNLKVCCANCNRSMGSANFYEYRKRVFNHPIPEDVVA